MLEDVCIQDVRYWHKADMLNAPTNVRLQGQSGHPVTLHTVSDFIPIVLESDLGSDLAEGGESQVTLVQVWES